MEFEAIKMDGLGNDFVIIDQRLNNLILSNDQILKICDRNFIGCDQLIYLNESQNADGEITIDGFYDEVVPLNDKDKAEIARVPFDENQYLELTGSIGLDGEAGYTAPERIGARPTLDLNGIGGGYQGVGTKTVLPSEAKACLLYTSDAADE